MIQERAMLANLTIRMWGATKKDKKVTEEVETQHNAHNAGRFSKHLVDRKALQALTNLCGRVRTSHYEKTLPWGDNGDRLLPSAIYLDYMKMMREYTAEYDALAIEFTKNYPVLVQSARTTLGTMYEPQDYPDPSSIRERFGIQLGFTPVPDAKDFRVDLEADAISEIRAAITATVAAQQSAAVKDVWHRIKEAVQKAEEKLSLPDAVFRDSLIQNIRSLVDIAPLLNITEDATLTVLIKRVKSELCTLSLNQLRNDPAVRKNVAECARQLLIEINSMQ